MHGEGALYNRAVTRVWLPAVGNRWIEVAAQVFNNPLAACKTLGSVCVRLQAASQSRYGGTAALNNSLSYHSSS